MNTWNEPSLQKATQKKYKGFSNKPTNDFLAKQIANGNAILVEMSPDEYIKRICYQIFETDLSTLFKYSVYMPDIEKYAKDMKKGDEFPIGYIDYIRKKQEGRHRALAAYLNGYEKIPVYIIK